MLKILREVFTGIDGQSHDLGRYSWAFSWAFVAFIALIHEARGHDVDLTVLAAAFVAIAAGHAGAIYMKRSTEPQPPDESKSITSQS
jgi:hypothetical protein